MDGSSASGPAAGEGAQLTAAHFERISSLLHRSAGIALTQGRESLVSARLGKRLRLLGLSSFDEYLERLERDRDGHELAAMVDALTTNKTSFFREAEHYDFLRRVIVPELRARRGPIRIWSAGCSSGEEPYSIAIELRERMPDISRFDVRILATDVSRPMLERVRRARYDAEAVAGLPADLLRRHFRRISSARETYELYPHVRALVVPARLNLLDQWPMRGPFDVIFCRNVMIYFDRSGRERLVDRFRTMLRPGGYFFVGRSESLAGANRGFRYLEPAVYTRVS